MGSKQDNFSRIRNYLCDKKAETVCCPQGLGDLVSSSGIRHQVYAVNNFTVGFRTGAQNVKIWQESEPFFWREQNCVPGLGWIFSILMVT